MEQAREPYVAVPDGKGAFLYFSHSRVMSAVNGVLQLVMQAAIDTSRGPRETIRKVHEMQTAKVNAAITARAFSDLWKSGEGITREKALSVASEVIDWKL